MNDRRAAESPTLMGHPTGLFNLFFAEMWERFSYYGMRALLVLYMVKGFMGLNDDAAYAIYGAYTALVYMTPFLVACSRIDSWGSGARSSSAAPSWRSATGS